MERKCIRTIAWWESMKLKFSKMDFFFILLFELSWCEIQSQIWPFHQFWKNEWKKERLFFFSALAIRECLMNHFLKKNEWNSFCRLKKKQHFLHHLSNSCFYAHLSMLVMDGLQRIRIPGYPESSEKWV